MDFCLRLFERCSSGSSKKVSLSSKNGTKVYKKLKAGSLMDLLPRPWRMKIVKFQLKLRKNNLNNNFLFKNGFAINQTFY